MTDYTDVPAVADLYRDRENITMAIDMITNGGGVSRMTVAAAVVAGSPNTGPPSVMIDVPLPNTTAFIQAVHDWLVTRQGDIDTQLAALGVTNPPAPSP